MKGLLRLLSKYEGPISADFQRVYGTRLKDIVLSRTPDEIEDLLLWLPADSAFRAAFLSKGDNKAAQRHWIWSDDRELMLTLLNLIKIQTYVIQQVQSPKKIKQPELLDSPRGKTPNGKRADADSQARAMLAAIKARKGR